MELLSDWGWAVALVVGLLALVLKVKPTKFVEDLSAVWDSAKEYVSLAESLWNSGKLPGDDASKAKFNFVFEALKHEFPDLDENTLINTLEAAVKWVKMLVNK